MGVPYNGSPMAQHPQYLTVRNSRGREMLDVLGSELTRTPAIDTGDRRPLVMQVRWLDPVGLRRGCGVWSRVQGRAKPSRLNPGVGADTHTCY
jgi:hypothetical protein